MHKSALADGFAICLEVSATKEQKDFKQRPDDHNHFGVDSRRQLRTECPEVMMIPFRLVSPPNNTNGDVSYEHRQLQHKRGVTLVLLGVGLTGRKHSLPVR